MTASAVHEGVVALVTGGSDGIGKSIAAQLLDEGASVAICARNPDRLAAAADDIAPGGSDRLLAMPADCTVPADMQRLHDATVERFGTVTALVNNAGTSTRGTFLDLTDEMWQADFDLKVFAAVRLSRLVAGALVAEGRPGRIVNMMGVSGKHPGVGSAPTTVSRAAGLALTKVLSKDLAQHGILVNAVCIGTAESGQHDRRWHAAGGDRDEYYAQLAKTRSIPLGRVAKPEEAAGLVSFLLSPAGSYITGAAINFDGGWSHAW